jgi:hypothetical protein
MATKKVLAWHFAPDSRHLAHVEETPKTLIVPGKVFRVKPPAVICKGGLHASVRAIDALQYAPGAFVSLVECSRIGDPLDHIDKLVCGTRRHIACADATATLRDFARQCALDVLHLWEAPDIVVRYLTTGDESLRATARGVAWDAAAWDAQNTRLEKMLHELLGV